MLSELLRSEHKALGLIRKFFVKAWAVLCLFAFCVDFCPKYNAQLVGLAVEQIRAEMPKISVYCSGTDKAELESIEASAYLDGEPLKYIGTQDGAQDGVDYIFLLDVSGSIKKADFEAAKEQILKFYNNLGEKDSLALVTFGNEVNMVFNGKAGKNNFKQKLMDLENGDAQTCLYEAIYSGVDYAQAQDVSRRQIMLVVSDGVQDTGSVGITQADVERELEQASLPLYSICTQSASKTEQEKFSAFAHQTGGEFYSYDSDSAQQVWQQLADEIDECGVLVFEGKNNLVDGESHTFMLKYSNGTANESITKSVTLAQWQPDEISPQVESINYLPDSGTLVLVFSEEVISADDTSAYCFVSDSKKFAAQSVIDDGENTYTVTLPEELPSGGFTLGIVGVTDNSMEKNKLDYEPVSLKKPIDTHKLWQWGAIAAGAILVVILAVVLFRRWKKSKEQVVLYRVEHVKASEPSQSASAGSASENAAQLTIGIMKGSYVEQKRTLRFNSSSIWGHRAEMCDLCIPDPKISKQHCVLEFNNNAVVISDLDSKNGTYLNGVCITQPYRLKQGDVIQIGDTQIKILDIALAFDEQDDCTIPL